MVHTPLLFWGADFRKNAVVNAPVANYDIAPTVLRLEGVKAPDSMRGRAASEAFAKGGSRESQVRTRKISTRSGSYCASVQLSQVGAATYVDYGQRCQ